MLQQAIFRLHHLIYGEQGKRKHDDRELYMRSAVYLWYSDLPQDKVWGGDFAGAYDGIIDFKKFKAAGGKFAIIKAADGTVKAKYWDENRAAAMDAGVPFGPYFWLYRNQRISGKTQAQAWWNIVKDNPGQLPGTVDFEWSQWFGKPDNPDSSDLYGAAIPYEQLSGRKPMIYSARGYLDQYFNHADFWKEYLLWIAQYGVDKPDAVAPWGAGGYTFWQFTDHLDGSPIGVDPHNSTAVDGDIFNGTLDEFNAQFGTSIPPVPVPAPTPAPIPQPTTGGSMTTKGTAKAGTSSNIKRTIDSAIVGHLSDGAFVFGDLSSAKTDIVNFDHCYTAAGQRVELGAACKVSVGNLTLTTADEPTSTPSPTPAPAPAPSAPSTVTLVDVTIAIDGVQYGATGVNVTLTKK